MKKYPYLVYRAVPGFYLNQPVTLVNSEHATESVDGIAVRWDAPPYDESHRITPECREALRSIGRRQQQESRLRVCMVYGPDDCDYIEPDGSINQSDQPPTCTIQLSDGDYSPEVIVNTFGKTEERDSAQVNTDLGTIRGVSATIKENSETVKLKDKNGDLLAESDGMFWTFYHGGCDTRYVSHESIAGSPYYLIRELESIGDEEELMSELSQKSGELKSIINSFVADRRRLEKRIVLFEKEGYGAIDYFIDRILLTGDKKNGYSIETTVAGDRYDFPCNAFGEILGERCDNVFGAEQLFEAINEVTDDDRWEYIEWSWDEILRNLRPRLPRLANDLAEIVKQEEKK